ncbi:uncharacterized protein LAESUDRAFT_153984 [Laetiporus sulphureus 93-53]|uniref:Uncharacterized protein n=1 Tax=Laetiporus sulphureus 93-53 TaxID=1314785 RepID=A0A165HJZ3_9APHY|nr:uncharacterized protein LAESUDRAFT_153984 [Laetiporus sulphureus 93-53]KZT11827.1 hypothetical protein LAESUDRAFT_153984 [Laetiporus sulphureus 93-53]
MANLFERCVLPCCMRSTRLQVLGSTFDRYRYLDPHGRVPNMIHKSKIRESRRERSQCPREATEIASPRCANWAALSATSDDSEGQVIALSWNYVPFLWNERRSLLFGVLVVDDGRLSIHPFGSFWESVRRQLTWRLVVNVSPVSLLPERLLRKVASIHSVAGLLHLIGGLRYIGRNEGSACRRVTIMPLQRGTGGRTKRDTTTATGTDWPGHVNDARKKIARVPAEVVRQRATSSGLERGLISMFVGEIRRRWSEHCGRHPGDAPSCPNGQIESASAARRSPSYKTLPPPPPRFSSPLSFPFI